VGYRVEQTPLWQQAWKQVTQPWQRRRGQEQVLVSWQALQKNHRSLRWLVIVAAVGLLVTTNAYVVLESVRTRRQALEAAAVAADNMVTIIDETTQRVVQTSELMLAVLSQQLVLEEDFTAVGNPQVHLLLRQNRFVTPFAQNILLLDSEGFWVNGAVAEVTGEPMSFADRDYFRVHRDGMLVEEGADRDALYVTEPIAARVGDFWFLGLSRAIYQDDTLLGVLVSIVTSEGIAGFYEPLTEAWEGEVSLLHTSGQLFIQQPLGNDNVGSDNVGNDNVGNDNVGSDNVDSDNVIGRDLGAAFGRGLNQALVSSEPLYDRPAVWRYDYMENYPFIVSATLPIDTALAAWRERTEGRVLSALLRSVFIALVAWGMWRYLLTSQRNRDTLARMQGAIDTTQALQRMLLPSEGDLKAVAELDIAGFMEAAEEVGGDYYDVLAHENGVRIGMGDVTGHGLESGIIMLMTQTAVRTLLESGIHDPKIHLDVVNRTLYHNIRRMQADRSLTLSLVDYDQGDVCISGQHESVLLMRANGDAEYIDTMDLGFMLGLELDIKPFVNEKKVHLELGDGIVLYTDGITEAENPDGNLYGLQRLRDIAQKMWSQPARNVQQAIVEDVKKHLAGTASDDDITLLVLKRQAV
jgi:serine phosphatase RsbU (regulator of sigma subunit)